jgi:hypothetical protein
MIPIIPLNWISRNLKQNLEMCNGKRNSYTSRKIFKQEHQTVLPRYHEVLRRATLAYVLMTQREFSAILDIV